MFVVVLFLFVAASVRLSMWRTKPASRAFTVGLFTLAVSYTLSIPWLGDQYIDPAFAGFFGQNISDLAHTLLIVVASYLIALAFLDVLGRECCRIAWSLYTAVTIAGLIVTSRFGDSARIPVFDEFQLGDITTAVYVWMFLAYVAVTCLLIVVGTAKDWRSSSGRSRRAYTALVVSGWIGVVYAACAVVWLVADPGMLAAHNGMIGSVAAAPILLGLGVSGLYGAVDARRRAVREASSGRLLGDGVWRRRLCPVTRFRDGSGHGSG